MIYLDSNALKQGKWSQSLIMKLFVWCSNVDVLPYLPDNVIKKSLFWHITPILISGLDVLRLNNFFNKYIESGFISIYTLIYIK